MKQYILFLFLSLQFLIAAAQPTGPVITGKVISGTNNAPLAGVSLTTRQHAATAITAADGSFSIAVGINPDTIIIDMPGYRFFSMAVSNTTLLPVTIILLPYTKDLDEVTINTGYQKIPKDRSTGSFTSISKSVLNQQAGTFLLDRLESITNGLYVDRQTAGPGNKIVIRGLSTIQGPRAPLIILDDFPYEGDLNNINPNDVENITVLKDAAAASIWGTRAGNGVIVITTKKGKYDQPLRVEYSSSALFTAAPDLFYVKDISPADYTAVEKFLYAKGAYTSQLNTRPWLGVSPVVELLKQRDLGRISAAQADSGIAATAGHNLRDELLQHVYQTGINLQQAISIRGGSKNFGWVASGGWDHNTDVLRGKYDRYNFKASQLYRIYRQLELSTSMDYTQTTIKAGRTGYGGLRPQAGSLPVYTQLAAADGSALPVMFQYRKNYTDTASGGKLMDWNWYPLNDYQNTDNSTSQQAAILNSSLSYKPLKTLTLSLNYQYSKQTYYNETLYNADSYFARDFVNSYSSLDRATGKFTYNVPQGGIIDNKISLLQTNFIRGQVNYSKKTAYHEFNGIAGAENRVTRNESNDQRTYGYDDGLLTYGTVDYKTLFKHFLTGSSSTIPVARSFSATLNRYISMYANAAYTYRNKYTLSASGRRDASNLFGASSNNKWSPLWSAGAAWAVSKESFYDIKLLPQLKLRMTYGVSGNADPARSAVTTITYSGVSTYTQLPYARISQFKNAQLSWEKVYQFNIGIDFASVNDRLQGSVEYYYKKARNLFGTDPVDYTGLAFDQVTRNVASISDKGIDINLNSRNTTGAVLWTSQLNLNFNRDKVLQYFLTNTQGSNFTSGSIASAIVGKPVYALYGYRWAGLDPLTGEPRGYFNGQVSKDYTALTGSKTQLADMVYSGPILPTAVASLGNTIAWKNFALTIRVTGKFGNYFQRPSIDYSNLFTNRVGHTDYALRWQQPGDEQHTEVPAMIYPVVTGRNNLYKFSELLATKADLIRLQYISFGYSLKKIPLQFYVNVNNLGLIWRANKFGIDPEYNNGLLPSKNIAIGFKGTF